MMFLCSKKRRCLRDYETEVRRQTDSYEAWINEKENSKISGKTKSGPLITVVAYGATQHKWMLSYENVEYLNEKTDIFDYTAMRGEWIAYVNGDGMLSETAFTTISTMLNHDLIYADIDYIDSESNQRHTPFFMPDWSPDTLSSFFYFGDFFIVRKSIAQQIEVTCSMDVTSRLYEFVRKYTKITDDIFHCPQVLYHRYSDKHAIQDTSMFFAFGTLPEWLPEDKQPFVSVIILSKDQFDILKQCIESIKIKSKYNKYEIIIVDNGSIEETKKKTEAYALENGYCYLYQPMEFNYSAMCNLGAAQAKGDFFLFMNDDVEVDDSLFIEKMLRYASLSHVGAVGAKLLYPNSDIIQHVGITNQDCGPSHKLATYSDNINYYFGRNRLNYNVLAVTGACMMTAREKYFQVGGFDDKMGVSYNDVDLCVSLFEAGYYNVICNDTRLYHHESLARGEDRLDEIKSERLLRERNCFYERHSWLKDGDPFYSPNLIQDTLLFRSNILYEYEDRNHLNHCRYINREELPKETEGVGEWNLERIEYVRKIKSEDADCICFEGWSLLMKKDNAYYDRSLLFIPPTGDVLEAAVSSKLREDVGQVFPAAKHSKLAGFVCRVKADEINTETVYRTAMLMKARTGTKTYIIPGEQYEPKR